MADETTTTEERGVTRSGGSTARRQKTVVPATRQAAQDSDHPAAAVREENAELRHTAALRGEGDGTLTTRDDLTDAGVPMLQGSPDEPQGPEDALGEGSKRGDYASRQDHAEHYESVGFPGAGEPVRDADGNIVDFRPAFGLVHQNPRVEDVGEVEGKKGGVETAGEAG